MGAANIGELRHVGEIDTRLDDSGEAGAGRLQRVADPLQHERRLLEAVAGMERRAVGAAGGGAGDEDEIAGADGAGIADGLAPGGGDGNGSARHRLARRSGREKSPPCPLTMAIPGWRWKTRGSQDGASPVSAVSRQCPWPP